MYGGVSVVSDELQTVKIGIAVVMLGLIFSVGMGISFGLNEDAFKDFVAEGVATHPQLHDEKSTDKIWRYAQRAHFHAGGIAAFSLGLIFLVMFSDLKRRYKKLASFLIGIGSLYPLAWFSMFFLAPSIGRSAAHDHLITEMFTYIGVGGLTAGLVILLANLFLGLFANRAPA